MKKLLKTKIFFFSRCFFATIENETVIWLDTRCQMDIQSNYLLGQVHYGALGQFECSILISVFPVPGLLDHAVAQLRGYYPPCSNATSVGCNA